MPAKLAKLTFDLILYGGPGSGKTTIANLLAPKYGLHHFAVGQLLREIAKQKTPLGLEIKSKIEAGKLINNKFNQQILDQVVDAVPAHKHIVFDGFPRTLVQAKWFDQYLEDCKRQSILVYLQVDLPVIRARLSERGRADDKDKAALSRRLATFKRNSKGIIAHYQRQKRLLVIDANGTPEEVVDNIICNFK